MEYPVLFCFLTLHSFNQKHTMITGLKPVHVCLHPFHQISQFGINAKFSCVCASNPPASSTFQVPLASKLTDQGTTTIPLTGVYTPRSKPAHSIGRGLIWGNCVHSVAWIPAVQRLAWGQLVKDLLMIDGPSLWINVCSQEKLRYLALILIF